MLQEQTFLPLDFLFFGFDFVFFYEPHRNNSYHHGTTYHTIHVKTLKSEHLLDPKPTNDFRFHKHNPENHTHHQILQILIPLLFLTTFDHPKSLRCYTCNKSRKRNIPHMCNTVVKKRCLTHQLCRHVKVKKALLMSFLPLLKHSTFTYSSYYLCHYFTFNWCF